MKISPKKSHEPNSRETDLVVEQHGVRVYVDPFTAQHLDGSAIDFDDGEEGGAAFTVTFLPDNSRANAFVNPIKPALLAE